MSTQPARMSPAFEAFLSAAPAHAKAWTDAVKGLDAASALDKKTEHLSYIAVLAALRLDGGVPFHGRLAKQAGASREEIGHAVRLMAERQIRRLPVVEDGKLVGILTLADIARDVARREGNRVPACVALAQTLASISEKRDATTRAQEAAE